MLEFNASNELRLTDNKNEKLIKNELLNCNNLSEDEILKCKENGFILIGKTGVGKTSLLNVLFGDDIGKVGYTSNSETKESNFYCIKETVNNNFIYFCIIDTPGLYDTDGVDVDINQKKDIQQLISKEKIKIKAILFLSNFQNERFDFSEQNSLLQYNALFPMKDFWNRLILIFTHYYGDPEGDSKEEIKERSLECFNQIINDIMRKVKNISDKVEFEDLNRKYINIYSKVKNDKQFKINQEIRNSLLLEISKYIKFPPMFSKLKIFHFENYQITENDDYNYDCDLIIYLDANDNVIKKDFNVLKKYPKNNLNKKQQKIVYDFQKCEINEEGNLVKINSKVEGFNKIFKNTKSKVGGAMTIFSIIGLIFSGIFFIPTVPFCIIGLVGGVYFIKSTNEEQHKLEQEKIKEIIENENINEEIKNELDKKD